MAKKYVSRVTVLINGSKQSNMKNFKTDALAYREQFQTMDGPGSFDVSRSHKFSLDYAIPQVAAKLDWSDIVDATVIVELKGGKRITYSAVDCLGRGEISFDNEKETIFTVNFAADEEVIE